MSSAAVIPPPNSSSLLRRVPRLTARARAMLTAMNLHFAGVAALGVLVLYLIAHLVFVEQALSSRNQDAVDQQRINLKAAELAAKPLRGLDSKLVDSNKAADKFYGDRLPYAYSQVASELGALTKHAGVRLSRVQYSQDPVLSGSATLNEVHMDASIAGDYRPVVQFINATERDKMFFVINGINLTGQQTGQVNLRIRLTTYLREPTDKEMTLELQPADASADSATGAKP
jgi:type IV pilus assembly protein PilO